MIASPVPRHHGFARLLRLHAGVVMVAAALVALAVALAGLSASQWDPTYFVAFGEDSPGTLNYGAELLGEVYAHPEHGHDGKFFFVQGNDPLLLEPDDHAIYLDRPAYRAQRMMYPLLSSAFGLASPTLVPWGMLLVNVVAMILGAAGTGRLAAALGSSPLWGLAFSLNPGLLFEFTVGGAGVVAFAAAVWAVVAVAEGRPGWAAAGLTGAALAKEVMLLMALGMLIWWWSSTGRIRWDWLLLPLGSALAWAAYVAIRLHHLATSGPTIREFGLPFRGLMGSLDIWVQRPLTLVTAFLFIGISLSLGIRAVRQRDLLSWSVLGFALLVVVLSDNVWWSYFDISRVLAPLLTIWLLVVFTGANEGGWQRDRGIAQANPAL